MGSAPFTDSPSASAACTAAHDPTIRLIIKGEAGKSLPPAALRVAVDKKPVNGGGRTFSVLPGKHRLVVQAAGYERYEQTLDARRGDHLEVPIQLRRVRSASYQKAPSAQPPAASASLQAHNPPVKQPPSAPTAGSTSDIHLVCDADPEVGRNKGSLMLDITDSKSGRIQLPINMTDSPKILDVVPNAVKLRSVVITDTEITATLAISLINHPKLRVDRRAAAITISEGVAQFHGHCYTLGG